jgi:nucleoside phosphorylase
MPEFRILHLSDLLLGSANDAAFDEIARGLTDKLRSRIHAIVISGNLTVDGEEESYRRAETVLARLADALLEPDTDGIRRNRVLVVPGRRDTRHGTSFDTFKEFHDRFFGRDIGRGRADAFDPKLGVFRGLKDMSLIGLSYWRNEPGDPIALDIATVGVQARNAADKLLRIDYAQRTPAIIASAEQIVFDGDPNGEPAFDALRATLRDAFLKTIHLFGAGPAIHSIPVPRTLDSVGFGTGPRADGFWPFNANLVTIDRPLMTERRSRRRRDDRPTMLSNTVYQQSAPALQLKSSMSVSGELDRFYDREPPVSREETYASLLERIEVELAKNPQLIIRGFPGVGKLAFFDFMKSRDRLKTQRIAVHPIKLEKEDRLLTKVPEIRAFLTAFEARVYPEGTLPLVMIHDSRRGSLRHDQKTDLKPLNDVFPEKLKVLLIQAEDDFTLAAERVSDRETVLRFPPLELVAVRNLVREFSSWVPARESQVRSITGGYAGFGELILEEAAMPFSRVSGAEPMREEITTTVLDRAFRGDAVAFESKLHRQTLERKTAGADICKYILEKVDTKRRACGGVTSLPPIEIDVAELKAGLGASVPKLSSVDELLEDLSESGILGPREEHGARITYRVEVLAPFVMNDKRARAASETPQPPEEAWPDIDDADLDEPPHFLIITALPQERDAVLRKLKKNRLLDPVKGDVLRYHFAKVPVTMPSGKTTTYRVLLTNLLNMGQVNAAIATTRAIDRLNPGGVLLVGIAGGVRANGVALGDLVVADQVAYYGENKAKPGRRQIRWQMIPPDARLFSASQGVTAAECVPLMDVNRPTGGAPNLHHNTVATGDTVVTDETLLETFMEVVPKLAGVEMEAFGVARAALQTDDPRRFLMIRGVSDLADPDKDKAEVAGWREYACDIAAAYTIALLKSGPLPLEEEK